MCLHAKESSFKVTDSVAPCDLPLFVLDEIEAQTYIQHVLHAQSQKGAGYPQKAFVLDHDLVDDG